ncbi:MAG TPA: tRNA pseudouridine(13) synthase TruD [Persephonella sp.]|nr:tRNA pseudouridine(13) synthase TruD [Hydrogenothermaceae bacterium]HIQ25203.1 tRNA pseudouridine(13) synthase TruD [Persephonella sp.]
MKYKWKIKEKPEDFIVVEKAYFPKNDGEYYLYLLVKRNLNTLDIAHKLNLDYAGLKDKNAITFQYVSSKVDYGDIKIEKYKNTFFILKKLGSIKRKVKIGQLEGNFFDIKLPEAICNISEIFINYFDTQRIKQFNISKGKKLLLQNKKLSKKENFFVDAYLSYLWNKSFELFLREKFNGLFLEEQREKFFIPKDLVIDTIPKFWTILGYKVKMEESKEYYEEILKKEGFSLIEFLQILKDKKIKGDYRRTYEKATDIKIYGSRVCFFLKKGAYATMYLKHLYTKNCIL